MKVKSQAAIAFTVAGALCATGGAPAFADDGSGVEQTAELVARLAPDQGDLQVGEVLEGVGVVTETRTRRFSSLKTLLSRW
jgi:hypothetical protein